MVTGFVKRTNPIGWGAIPMLLLLGGCATVPGKTTADQIQTVDQLIETTLADLVRQNPDAQKELDRSVGYVIMNNKITKIPVFGAGAGYGAAVARARGEKTYLRRVPRTGALGPTHFGAPQFGKRLSGVRLSKGVPATGPDRQRRRHASARQL